MALDEYAHDNKLNTNDKDTLYSWFIAFWLFVANCIEDGISKAFGVALITLSEEYDVKVWQVGSTVSVMIFVGSALAMLISPVSKTLSLRLIMMGCGLITSLGLIFASFASNWTSVAIVLVLFTGTGLRCSAVLIYSSLHNIFDQYYALASGFISAGRPIGTMIFAPLTQKIIYSYGVRGTLLILGAISFHISFVGALLKPKNSKYQKIENEDDDSQDKHSDHKEGYLSFIFNLFEVKIITNPKFVTLSSSIIGMVFGFQVWVIYLVPHAISKDLTPYQGTALSSFGCVGQLIGLASSGFIIDKGILKEHEVRLISLLCIGVSFAIDPWCKSFLGLLMLSFLCGWGVTFIYPAITQATRNIGDEKNQPIVFAYFFLIGAIGRLISGFLTGWLYDQTGNYTVSFFLVGGVEFAAAIIVGTEVALSLK